MACNDYGLKSSGFILPTQEQTAFDIQNSMRASLPGLSFAENSLESALASVMAREIQCLYNIAFDVYTSRDPLYATGCRLDGLGIRSGIARLTDESDLDYRKRIIRINSNRGSFTGSACFDGLYSELFGIDGVLEVQINLNDSTETSGGLPPHSYEVMVIGGDDQEIANAIWNRHPPGITIVGNTGVQIVDCTNICRTVNFTRPIFVPIFMDIRLERTSKNCGCPTDDVTVIKSAIKEYIESEAGVCFNRIGEPVSAQEFLPAVYTIQGVGVTCAKISRDCLTASNDFITLQRNEVPFFDVDSFNIQFTARDQSPCQTGDYVSPPESCAYRLGLEIQTDKTEFTAIGQVITYTYTVTNIGDTPVQGNITISDTKNNPICNATPANGLVPGDSLVCSAVYETDYDDGFEGAVVGIAQAVAGSAFSEAKQHRVSYTGPDFVAGISLIKRLVSGVCNAVGNTLEYTYTITNTGNVPITQKPVITDDKIPDIVTPPIPSGGLLPGQSISAAAQTIVTQEIFDNGEICNTARATAATDLGPVVSNASQVCLDCSSGATTQTPPSAPPNALINQCQTSFPYTTAAWTTSSGTITLTDNGTANAIGLSFEDNGDGTATIDRTSNRITNGTIAIVGDNGQGQNTQNVVVNCEDIESETATMTGSCYYSQVEDGPTNPTPEDEFPTEDETIDRR